MARESKQKRDEKRFGKAERLADKILATTNFVDIGAPSWSKLDSKTLAQWTSMSFCECRDMIADCPVVVADNVAEYHYSVSDKMSLSWTDDFPNCRPPFPRLFLEFKRPPFFRGPTGCQPFGALFPSQWGQIVDTLDASKLSRTTGQPRTDAALLPMLDHPDVAFILRFVGLEIIDGVLLPGAYVSYVPIAESGKVVGHPQTMLTVSGNLDDADALEIVDQHGQFLQTGMLAISFMHFQNVSVDTVEPDLKLNRERRKAGLKPFVRYHTIDIGPVREVLRTQGQIETMGLKHALHQCRGHFATYATSFMGRQLEKPMIVWRPSHLRGSAKQGVVVSDYNVKAPGPNV